jgi:hypothetical protein
LVAALAFPAFAAAESTEEGGAVVEPVVTSQKEAQQFWTQARLESAEPLSVLTLPESPLITQVNPEPEQTVNAAEGAGIATLAATADGQMAGREGVEIGSSESTVFPNSANGKVYGAYVVEGSIEPYECSGSVVHSSQGDVVLTAGHCVVDRETGAEAKFLMFKPAYNHGSAPRGTWFAAEVTIPESWKKTAKAHSSANEGADLAFLTLYKNGEKKNVEEVVGGLGIGFDQTCNQTYTQYGYPAESPYDGESLFTHVAPYAGADTNLFFTPEPMKIASDFTPGRAAALGRSERAARPRRSRSPPTATRISPTSSTGPTSAKRRGRSTTKPPGRKSRRGPKKPARHCRKRLSPRARLSPRRRPKPRCRRVLFP